MFIDTITTDDTQLLLIESDGTVKLYEWLSEAWQPITPEEAEKLVMEGNAKVRGIRLTDPKQEDNPF